MIVFLLRYFGQLPSDWVICRTNCALPGFAGPFALSVVLSSSVGSTESSTLKLPASMRPNSLTRSRSSRRILRPLTILPFCGSCRTTSPSVLPPYSACTTGSWLASTCVRIPITPPRATCCAMGKSPPHRVHQIWPLSSIVPRAMVGESSTRLASICESVGCVGLSFRGDLVSLWIFSSPSCHGIAS